MKILLICNYRPGVGGISGQVELLQQHLREEGHTADIFSTKGSALWRLGLFYRLRKVAKEYDVLHIHCCSDWGFLPAIVGVTVGRRLRKRIVLTYHGGGGERFFAKHARLVKHFLTRTDTNIVLSGFLGTLFDKYHLPYTVIPNIIDFDDSQFRLRESIQPHFICTRSHEALYNIPCILRAFGTVQATHPEATLTLIGDGSEHKALKALSTQLGLRNTTFIGRIDNREIFKYLNQADILLSTPEIDNMPASLLEAMNVGLLVISTKVGGVPYMINDGVTGLLVDSDDSARLANLMCWSIENPIDAKTIILNARQEVTKYRWEHIKDQLYQSYGLPA